MKKTLFLVIVFFNFFFLTNCFSMNMYEKPSDKSKIKVKVKDSSRLTAIFYDRDKKDWVKVVDPQSDNIGWVKTEDFKGPIVITKTRGSQVEQQVIVNDKEKGASSYSVTQYSSKNLQDANDTKISREMQEYEKKMNESVRRMRRTLQKSFQEMAEIFSTYPLFAPMPDDAEKSKVDAKNN